MATYRQVYIIMRARDDATRIMRGMGGAFGHIAKEQAKLGEASKRAQQDFTNAIRNSTQAQAAATKAVQQHAARTIRSYQQTATAVKTSIKAAQTAAIQGERTMMQPLEQNNKLLSQRNAFLREQMSLGSIRGNVARREATQEIAKNNHLIAQNKTQLGLHQQTIESARNVAKQRMTAVDNWLRHETKAQQTMAQRRVAAIEAAAAADKRAATARNQMVQRDIQNQRAYLSRVQGVQGAMVGMGQAAILAGGLIGMTGVRGTRALLGMADAAAEFSNQNRVAISVAKDFTGSVSDLGDAVLKVAREVPVPIEDLQETFYYTFSALDVGLREATVLIRGFANEAVVGNANIVDAARSTIAMINAYQFDVSNAAATTKTLTRLQNMQFNTVKWGALTYEDLSKNIGKIIPAAVRAGQEVEQIGGALAFATRQGLSAEMASTSVARAMELIADARVVSRLERLGVTVRDSVTGEMRQLNDIVVDFGRHLAGLDPAGVENMMQVLAPLDADESQKYINLLEKADDVTKKLSGPERAQALQNIFVGSGNRIQARRFWDMALKNYEELDRLTKNIINDSESFGAALEMAFNEPAVAMGIFENRMAALKITIGEELIPIKLALLAAVTKLVNWWEQLDNKTKSLVTKFMLFGAIAAGVGGSLIAIVGILGIASAGMMNFAVAILGAQASMVKLVATSFGMAVGIPLLLGTIIAAIILLVIHWDELTEKIAGAVRWFRELDIGSQIAIVAMTALAVAIGVANASFIASQPLVAGFIAGLAKLKTAAIAAAAGLKSFAIANPIIAALVILIGSAVAIHRILTRESRATEEATRDYSDALYAQKDALADNIDALDRLNRAQLVQRLDQQGLFEQAQRLGVSSKTLTDAIMGEKDAIDRVNEAVSQYNTKAGFSFTERGKNIKASHDVAAAMRVETAGIERGIQAFIARAHAIGGVESAVATLIEIQRRGGPLDSAEEVRVRKARELIAGSEGLKAALAGLPPEMQEIAAEAGLMAEGLDDAEDATITLSAAGQNLKSVLESINNVSDAFTKATSTIVESLRETHEQALQSGDLTQEAFEKITESALKESTLVAQHWIENLQEQERVHNDFLTNIKIITARGGGDVVDIIMGMGDNAVDAMHTLANAGAGEFEELERLLTASATRTSDETVAQMDALKTGMTEAISEGMAQALFDFGQGMKLMEILARGGGNLTSKAIADELGIGVREVRKLANQFSLNLTAGINPVLEGIGSSKRITLPGSVLAFQRGGPVPGGFGGGDIIPAMLEPGEFVLRKEVVKNLDPQSLHEFNKRGYKAGGFVSVDDVPPVPPGYANYGTALGVVGNDASTHQRNEVVDWLKTNLAPQLGPGIGWQAMMAALRVRFPGLPLYSGLRPGAITATGRPSYHGMGRAVDIPPRMDVNKWIAENYFAQTKELILSLSGATQIKNGRPHQYTGITRAMHFDHNHWAMARGGIVTQPTRILAGEAGPEAIIPLDRLTQLIMEAMRQVSVGTEQVGITDQYQNMLRAIDALRAQVEANTRLAEARAEVARFREELSRLGSEWGVATRELNAARNEGRQIAKQQGDLVNRLGLSTDLWRNAMTEGKVVTLETEQSIIKQMQTVAKIRKELAAMRTSSGPTPQQELSILQARKRVAEQQQELAQMRNPKADAEAIRSAQDSIRSAYESITRATERFREAQAELATATATVAQAHAEYGAAQAELRRVERIIPHLDDEVAGLLMRYEAQARVADAQKATAEANEGLVKSGNAVAEAQRGIASAEQELTTANQSLAEARRINKFTADELRMAELELIIAQQQLTEAMAASTISAEDLRLKEIELLLAEQELQTLRENAFTFLPEYIAAQEKQQEITDKMKVAEDGLADAIRAVTDAERAAMDATFGLVEATRALYGLSPEALAYFRLIATQAGISTDVIDRQIASIRQLNSITGVVGRATTVAQDAHNRGLPGSGRDLEIIKTQNLELVSQRIAEIFRNRNVPISLNLDGSRTDPNARLRNLATAILAGNLSFEALRRSVDRIKAAHNLAQGGIVQKRAGGILARIGEGNRDEAVIPLPPNWRSGGALGGTEVEINIQSGAVQVRVEGSVGEGGEEAIREEVERGIKELLVELRRDWRGM